MLRWNQRMRERRGRTRRRIGTEAGAEVRTVATRRNRKNTRRKRKNIARGIVRVMRVGTLVMRAVTLLRKLRKERQLLSLRVRKVR